jgi:hypothetical protein
MALDYIPVQFDCDCEKGTMVKTALKSDAGLPQAFLLTADLRIVFIGYCSVCGQKFQRYYFLMDLIFACPKEWEVH